MKLTAMKYWGGKARPEIKNWINSILPNDTKVSYIEPFAGMLGILLSRPKSKCEIINDIDGNITNWWKTIREQPDELAWMIHHTECSRDAYETAFDMIRDETVQDNTVKWAWATYTVIQHGIVHALAKKGFGVSYYGRNPQLGNPFAAKIKPLADRLKDVQIENTDACKILERTMKYDFAIVYCDPPYIAGDTTPYNGQTLDVEKVSELLKEQKGRVAISGYEGDWDHLGWHRHTTKASFSHVGVSSGKDAEERIECLWTNYDSSPQSLLF